MNTESGASRPVNVLHVIDSGGVYGAEKVILALSNQLLKCGHRSKIATIVSPADDGDPLGSAAKNIGLSHVQFFAKDGFRPGLIRRLLEYVRLSNVDVVHCHGYRADILLGCLPRRKRPCPFVTTLHGWTAGTLWSKMGIYEALDRRCAARMNAVVAVSELIESAMAPLVPGDRLFRISNALDSGRGTSRAIRAMKAAGSPRHHGSETLRLLYVGRLSREKGVDVLIGAVCSARRGGVSLHLDIAGDGPELESLMTMAQKSGVSSSVTFHGYVSDISGLFQAASALVIPSRSEGLPIVLLEAMAAGVPVIATRVGQIPEVLADADLGLLVVPESPDAIASAIAEVSAFPDRIVEMATRAKQHVEKHFSVEAMANSYVAVYKRLVAA